MVSPPIRDEKKVYGTDRNGDKFVLIWVSISPPSISDETAFFTAGAL
jgi:hypothetical protein